MNPLQAAAERLRARLDAAITAEGRLAETLVTQERALLCGKVDEILATSAALDSVYAELREVSNACRDALFELAPDSGPELKLAAVLKRLPPLLADPLSERRTRLLTARRERARRVERNALIARVSLDAAASTRGVIARSIGAGAGASPLSQLDARV